MDDVTVVVRPGFGGGLGIHTRAQTNTKQGLTDVVDVVEYVALLLVVVAASAILDVVDASVAVVDVAIAFAPLPESSVFFSSKPNRTHTQFYLQ